MALHVRVCTIRTVALIGAALAALIGGTSRDALASAGCTAVNALPHDTIPASTSAIRVVPGPWAAGDTITVSGTPNANVQQANVLDQNNARRANPFVVASGEINDTLRLFVDANANGGVTVTYACTPAASGNTDTQKISALQVSTTKLVATTSGQVITNAIDGGINDAFSNGGAGPSFGPGGGFINFFAAEPRDERSTRNARGINFPGGAWRDDANAGPFGGGLNRRASSFAAEPQRDGRAQEAQEAYAALGYAGPPKPRSSLVPYREWNLWADVRGTGWKVNDTTGTGNELRGNQLNLTAGLGRKLTPDTLVGVVLGYENFKYDVAALAGTLKGDGESIGGYFARRFGNLRFDAALAWTYLNYNATAGTATGSFVGNRWLASTDLTGNHRLGAFVLEPSAKLYILWEREKAWTDSLGTLQAARNFSAGRTALGAQLARPFDTSSGWRISPYAGLYGDWRFSTDNALPTGTPVANIGDGWSGRVTSGLMAIDRKGATLSVGGEYGGLGANYKIWSGNVRAMVPF